MQKNAYTHTKKYMYAFLGNFDAAMHTHKKPKMCVCITVKIRHKNANKCIHTYRKQTCACTYIRMQERIMVGGNPLGSLTAKDLPGAIHTQYCMYIRLQRVWIHMRKCACACVYVFVYEGACGLYYICFSICHWCVCVCVCVCTCMSSCNRCVWIVYYVYVHTWTSTHIHARKWTHTYQSHPGIYIRKHACMCVCMCVCMQMNTYVSITRRYIHM